MIKFACGFPRFKGVALHTVIAKATFVRVAMAGHAARSLAEEGLAEILHSDEIATGGQHVRRSVALYAGCDGVFAFEFVAAEIVIEFLEGSGPLNQIEGFSVVLQMAAHAIFAVGIAHLNLEVVAVLGRKILGDFLVAIEALEGGRDGAKGVARCALRASFK